MQKLEDVAIPMKNDTVTYLVGNENIEVLPREPYDDVICDFLHALSQKLLKNQAPARLP